MVYINEACKPTSRPRVFSMGTVEDGLFDYDLGLGEQQLISNSQFIINNNQTHRDFSKQTPLNPTPYAFWLVTQEYYVHNGGDIRCSYVEFVVDVRLTALLCG